MVITIHNLPVGSFTFLQCLSGIELLNLSGTPHAVQRVWNITFVQSVSGTRHQNHFLSRQMILKKVNYPFQVVLPTSANPSEASTG
jgi:hypothetical protein